MAAATILPQAADVAGAFSSEGYLDMELLRFTTAGSVDDGKSTLIGRLLYDSKSIFDDQYEAVRASSERRGEDYVNLALLTDGLRAEREQGITIDVAYRYFATPKRKFIIADTPGHIQYTRNMVTGASTADLALILVDARNGVIEQTRRHAYIAALLGLSHVVVCVNKMDLVDWNESTFLKIRHEFSRLAPRLPGRPAVHFLPISALLGDNVVDPSGNMAWYGGPTLLSLLENVRLPRNDDSHVGRLPVQHVIRPQSSEYHDYRGYAGRVAGGVFRPGDPVTVLPSGHASHIRSIDTFDGPLDKAFAGQSVTLTLDDDIDISRGDLIARGALPTVSQDLDLMVCWLGERPLQPNGKYALRHATRDVRAVVRAVQHKININTLEDDGANSTVGPNDIARIHLRTTQPLSFDPYRVNRQTGSLILIDEATNVTVGAGMIV